MGERLILIVCALQPTVSNAETSTLGYAKLGFDGTITALCQCHTMQLDGHFRCCDRFHFHHHRRKKRCHVAAGDCWESIRRDDIYRGYVVLELYGKSTNQL
ncbi:hypothetical protein [Nitrosomonas supralitoralis]|uniref:hypothetical protein n=1 Tax=Nitrosomonas supralitoralis TaxID=2116706 RepID=UPI001F5B212B|nr:hypothetical protein [Nitrosomonas supralitoralis]